MECMSRVSWRSVWVVVGDAAFGRGWRYLSCGNGQSCSQLTHNIGILAHIDAGKTTTTERMLYYAGVTSRVGNVDSGSTVMDYLPPERERGITISSAAISLSWAGHTLNLVDTPGHADFTFEVERALCVLDGAVALLDASSGVEAQTVAVCRQANRYHIPYIAFVNKMDSPRANLHNSVESMKQRLGVQPLLTQLPLGKGRDFKGVVDLVHNHALLWEKGREGSSFSQVTLSSLPPDIQESSHHHREQLLEQVAMGDDTFAALLLDNEQRLGAVDPSDLASAIRRACVSRAAIPVLCGSALRGVAIQPLMDAAAAYLPSASSKTCRVPAEAQGLCAYAFKQVYDIHRGLLVYLRVFAGTLKAQSTIYNASSHSREKVSRVLQAQADELQEVREASEGSIAVAVGLKHTATGDTLVQSSTVARALGTEDMASLLPPPTIPPPVFFCTVEPSSAANQRRLDHALQCLSREDPSLRVRTDKDSGQTVLSGMGELHLEIVEERLRRVYSVDCELGQLQVAYKEGLAQETERRVVLEHVLGSSRQSIAITVGLSPMEVGEGIDVTFDPVVEVSTEEKQALRDAVESCLTRGPLLGFPVEAVTVTVHELSRSDSTPLPVLCSSLSTTVLQVCLLCVCLHSFVCSQQAVRDADMRLLEPVTVLEVTIPEQHVGGVLSDLTSVRRAQIEEVSEGGEGESVATACVPLATLLGYASKLRSLTSGTGTFTMVYSGHCPVDQHQLNIITQQLRGY